LGAAEELQLGLALDARGQDRQARAGLGNPAADVGELGILRQVMGLWPKTRSAT
jgi:hypothetical protein